MRCVYCHRDRGPLQLRQRLIGGHVCRDVFDCVKATRASYRELRNRALAGDENAALKLGARRVS